MSGMALKAAKSQSASVVSLILASGALLMMQGCAAPPTPASPGPSVVNPTPTPTYTPDPSPSPTPTPYVSPTPTAILTYTPTPTPTPVASYTPVPETPVSSIDCPPSYDLSDKVTDFVDFAEICLLNLPDGYVSQSWDIPVMLARLNEVRRARGLRTLIWHEGAAEAARLHAVDMLERDYFAHHSPEGLSASDRLSRIDRDEIFGVTGENLAWFSGSEQLYTSLTLQTQLENSPSHFRAMTNSGYSHVGMSIVRRGKDYVAVQVFIYSYGQLDEDVPTSLHAGESFELPDRIGGRAVGGWLLTDALESTTAQGDDAVVEIPPFAPDLLSVSVLAAVSPTAYLILNGPIVDVQ